MQAEKMTQLIAALESSRKAQSESYDRLLIEHQALHAKTKNLASAYDALKDRFKSILAHKTLMKNEISALLVENQIAKAEEDSRYLSLDDIIALAPTRKGASSQQDEAAKAKMDAFMQD